MPLVDSSPMIRKSDPEVHEDRVTKLKSAIKSGSHLEIAAKYAGVNPATLKKWLDHGRTLRDIWEEVMFNDSDLRQPSSTEMELIWLADEVDRAEADSEVNLVKLVDDAARGGDWRAAKWLLEARHKERWSTRTEVTGADGGEIKVTAVEHREMLVVGLEAIREKVEAAEQAMLQPRPQPTTPDADTDS